MTSPSASMTILVVDDIPLMRAILVKYIRRIANNMLREEFGVASVEILEAENGRVALDLLRRETVDFVFLDMMMPEMDGLAFLREKASDPGVEPIPVIVCSALGEREAVAQAKGLGAHSYITKPFTLKSVEQNLRDAVRLVTE